MTFLVRKIVSGGQTGVDRAALDFALSAGIPCDGWCPAGRISEDGTIPLRYPLTETGTSGYPERTRKNITHSDGTLILTLHHKMDRGTVLTRKLCEMEARPCLIIEMTDDIYLARKNISEWMLRHSIVTLNIAGCRESFCPGIRSCTERFLRDIFIRP